ncbi:MAG: DUF2079 domain-containing protein [Neisseriaceae bacterium]
MAKNRGVENLANSPRKNIDYIAYLMLIPSIAPILYINISNAFITFYGGFYILTSIVLVLLFIFKNKTIISGQDQLFFSKQALSLFFLVTFISLTYSIVFKYLAFRMDNTDAGIFISMIRDVFYGKFGYATGVGFYHLERHQNYILFLLATVYFIFFKSIIPVLILNATAILGAGFILYKITRLYFNQLIALVVAFTFYASPIHSSFTWFYPEVYYVLAITLMFYVCITKQKALYIILAACFLLSIKEEAPLYMLGFLFIMWQHKRFRLMSVLVLLTVSVALINIVVVEPYFQHKNILLGTNPPNIISTYFTKWGISYGEIIKNIITNPIDFISFCFDASSGFWPNYMYWFFLPLLSPFVLLSSIPVIFLSGASDNTFDLHQMINYHSLGVGVIAYIGIIIVFKQFVEKIPKYKQVLQTILLFIMLSHNMLFVNYSALFSNQSSDSSIPSMDLFMRMPLNFLWWRAYYKVNFDDVLDNNKNGEYIEKHYHNASIRVASNIYNNMLNFDLPNLQRNITFDANNNHLYQENCNCILVFTYDPSGLLQSQLSPEDISGLNKLFQSNKCDKFGKFYSCDNRIIN